MDPRTPATDLDVFAQYGRNLGRAILERRMAPAIRSPDLPAPRAKTMIHNLIAQDTAPQFNFQAVHPALESACAPVATRTNVVPVGILGGGMAGLYTALMLSSMKIPFQILEASDRVGGRCYTYKFDGPEAGEWEYYDVGAMRFPLPKDGEKGPHLRLKKLFDLLGLPLFDYIYKTPQGIMLFNNVRSTICDKTETYNAAQLRVPNCYIAAGVHVLCDDYIKPLANLLLKDMKDGSNNGWNIIRTQYDRYSTRAYLQFCYVPSEALQNLYGIPGTSLPTDVINWMETFDKSTGWYDRALTETILEAIAFGTVGPEPEWHCIQHGTSVLPIETLKKVRQWAEDIPNMPADLIVMESPVTAITPSDPKNAKSPLIVTTADGQTYAYSHVISTTPLPNFAIMNTDSLNISVMQRNAIRQLQYGPSIKIGMLFKTAWWKDYEQVGGQSFTDLPVRTIVYPSYGEDQSSKVLIASYCWTNDAEKLGNLIDSGVDGILDDLVLRDLATVHGAPLKFLKAQHVKTYSWNWNHDPWTGGAFAFFGPGQYEYLYDALNSPAAEGRFQWAGELLSVRHAWIVGALDSAWAAVLRYLFLSSGSDPNETYNKFKKFYELWDVNLEWDTGVDHDEGSQKPTRGDELAVPHARNLLLHHMISHDPDLVVLSQESL